MIFQYFISLDFLIPIQQLIGDPGFLIPTFANSTNIGAGIDIPYFWNISKDKDITFTPRIQASHQPLYLAEYRQDFAKSSFITDIGYTEGYKKKTNSKTPGSRSHFFLNFILL